MKKMKLVFISIAMMFMVGCSATTATVPNYIASGYSQSTIERAILASTERGWVMRKTAPGVITGSLVNRGHTANIRIPYTANGYKIELVSSSLGDSSKIHRNYNRWVTNLDAEIKANLIRIR